MRALHRGMIGGVNGRRGVKVGTYQHRETAESVSLWRKHPFSHHEQHQLLLLHATRARLLAPDPGQHCTSLPVGWVGVRACKTGASSCLMMSSSWTVFLLTRVLPLLMAATLLLCLCLGFGRLRCLCSSWNTWNGALYQTQLCISASIEIGEFVSGRDSLRKMDWRLDCAAKEVSRLVLTDAG